MTTILHISIALLPIAAFFIGWIMRGHDERSKAISRRLREIGSAPSKKPRTTKQGVAA